VRRGSVRAAAAVGRSPVLRGCLGAGCISASAILVRLADTGAATTVFFRCALALPVLLALATVERRRRGLRALAVRRGAAAAGLWLAVDLVLWNYSIADLGAGVATALESLQVLFVALAAWAVYQERPGRRFLVALPVVITGVVGVSGLAGAGGGTTGMHPLAGSGYRIGAAVAGAGFILTLRRTSAGAPHVAGPLADASAGGAAASLLLGLAFGGLQLRIGWPSFWWLLALSMTSQTIGWLLITSSLPKLPAAFSSLMLLLQPTGAMLLAAAVLGERPSLVQMGGAAMVCCGILAAGQAVSSRRAPARSRPAPNPAVEDHERTH